MGRPKDDYFERLYMGLPLRARVPQATRIPSVSAAGAEAINRSATKRMPVVHSPPPEIAVGVPTSPPPEEKPVEPVAPQPAEKSREEETNLLMRAIQACVAAEFNTTIEDLVGTARPDSVVLPRHIAMWIGYRVIGLSFQEVGKRFGGRDHTTVRHAVEKIDHMKRTGPSFSSQVERICGRIRKKYL